MEQLYALGALDDKGKITKLGLDMAEFPLEPTLAKVLFKSITKMENNKLHTKILRCIEIIERANKAIDFHIDTDENERDFRYKNDWPPRHQTRIAPLALPTHCH